MDIDEIKGMFMKALEYIDKNDPIQASEKLYKVCEECIKLLAEINGIDEYNKAREKEHWSTSLLQLATNRLSMIYGNEIKQAWDSAYRLHIEGFHENRLGIEDVKYSIEPIERLLRIVEQEVNYLRSKKV